ncbi:MAG: DUF177 domain-containing protein [Clostridia bacterium]|nr:DUF177 domain-containing protein [Clostridia bacterium]
MLIELKKLFENEGTSLPLCLQVDLSDVQQRGEPLFVTPVSVEGEIRNRLGIVTLQAEARFTYRAPCDRCAEPVERAFTLPVAHGLVAELNNEDNDDFLVVENMKLDVDELIRSDVLLSLPTKFLCREDCKGLCSKCGANLNLGTCECAKEVDPRLSALLELMDQ